MIGSYTLNIVLDYFRSLPVILGVGTMNKIKGFGNKEHYPATVRIIGYTLPNKILEIGYDFESSQHTYFDHDESELDH